MKFKHYMFLFLAGLVFIIICPESIANAGVNATPLHELETKYTIIRYRVVEDLVKINQKLECKYSLKSTLSETEKSDLERSVPAKIDTLFERVGEILDMHKKMPKVIINAYSDRKHLDEAYFGLYKKKGHLKAWYLYEYNTIYLSVCNLHDGLLAHEMAHAIIDHYLLVRPPKASAEILARYVDDHINKNI